MKLKDLESEREGFRHGEDWYKPMNENKWIAFSENDPGRGERIWAATIGGCVVSSTYTGNEISFTHWMPYYTPEPPPKPDACEEGLLRMINKHTEWDSLNVTVASLAYRQCWLDLKTNLERYRKLLMRVLEWCEQDSPDFEIDADEIRDAIANKVEKGPS